jgi:hypothetical protein
MKKFFFLMLVVVLFLTSARTVSADYQLLQSLPGLNNVNMSSGGFQTYIERLVKISLSVTGILAVIMIIIAGIEYIWAGGSQQKIDSAKNRIWQAIWGLLIALSAYLILYTINPDLVSFNLGITSYNAMTEGGVPAEEKKPGYQYYCIDKTICGNIAHGRVVANQFCGNICAEGWVLGSYEICCEVPPQSP